MEDYHSAPKPFLGVQTHQFVILFILLLVGKYFINIYPSWIIVISVFLVAMLTEHVGLYIRNRELKYISISPLSTSIGIILMLGSIHWWIYAIVTVLSMAQKHFLSIDKRHFYNPSNFAVIIAMLLFYRDTHVVMGQLGDSVWLRIFVILLSISILFRVDRWIVPIVFVFSYLVLQKLLVLGYDPVMNLEMAYERFYSLSFVVFSLFMLTDPRTTPDNKLLQILFAFIIALVTVYLDRIHGFRIQHMFMALFLTSVWVPFVEADSGKRKKIFLFSFALFILGLMAIIYLESLPPYYLEMEG